MVQRIARFQTIAKERPAETERFCGKPNGFLESTLTLSDASKKDHITSHKCEHWSVSFCEDTYPENRGFPVFKNVSSVKSLSDGHLVSISSASSAFPMRRSRLAMLLYEFPIRSL